MSACIPADRIQTCVRIVIETFTKAGKALTVNKLSWRKWWRIVDGQPVSDWGFSFDDDPDTYYFDIDPMTQVEQIDEDDERCVHVDDLFEQFSDIPYVQVPKER